VEVREEIEALVAFEGRFAGTDAERRVARHLAGRLEALGREVDVEPLDVWPAFHVTHALHAVLGIVASLISVGSPIAGLLLAALSAASTFGDAGGLFFLVRRFTGRRASQNVVSREHGGKRGTLLLCAHVDAGRTGYLYSPRLQERLAALGRFLRRPLGPVEPLLWSLLVILVCCVLRVLGLEGGALNIVQFVPTVALVLAVPLILDLALSRVVPGANDDASGVATALRLAERFGGRLEHFDVWVLLTGAQEPFALGMRGWLKRHRRRLDRASTVFVNLDEVGSGTVRFTRREGLMLTVRSHVQLVELCGEVAEDSEGEARGIVNRAASDGYAARSAGFPAVTITSRNALDYLPDHHRPTDVPDRLDPDALERSYAFAAELIERLDATVGPDLSEGPD
jgi:Peptidase family M28